MLARGGPLRRAAARGARERWYARLIPMAGEPTIALEHFAQEAKDLVGEAQNLADERKHALVEPIHLLVRAVDGDRGIAEVFRRASAEPAEVLKEAESQLTRLGKTTSGLAYLSNAMLALLERAKKEAAARPVPSPVRLLPAPVWQWGRQA